ncbi:MAG: Gfo/Idh/MocA family oxidoreductase [Vicinamibacteria bacterium]|nr:Gfo/Idh/MocA family oxidoreductase [Vicinamibacteria bacterium]
MSAARLRVGLIGLGRLGRVYARDLASRIGETRLAAVCDPIDEVVSEVADEFEVGGRHTRAEDLIADPGVEAVVIVTPTRTHRDLAVLCARAGKPAFCEKPAALSLGDALAMKEAVERSGSFLQMGFMRRFDSGYVAARARLSAGDIGKAVLFKSSSRDPQPPPLAYADPRSSGGLILDLGIHDFDLARFFMGEVGTVSAIGGALAFPELATVGDIDNAVVTLTFRDGRLGVVDLSRHGVYGYDVSTEILGDAGALRVGALRETPLSWLTRNNVSHDTPPGFLDRFAAAYTAQLADFARNVLLGRPAPVSIDDGIEALRIALAARQSLTTGRPVEVASVAP